MDAQRAREAIREIADRYGNDREIEDALGVLLEFVKGYEAEQQAKKVGGEA